MSEIDDMINALKQKRDELRVQMHLASKEAQDEWEELEEKMQDFTAKAQLRETSQGLGKALGQVGEELKAGYDRIRRAIKES